jgi:hypothetical protein
MDNYLIEFINYFVPTTSITPPIPDPVILDVHKPFKVNLFTIYSSF